MGGKKKLACDILHFYLASFTCLLLAMQFFDVRNASDVVMFASSRGKLRETPRYQNLWDLIVNNDDICFKHVLPRLNPTDLKFLYEVNTETRALVKRSSRKRELKKKFNIEEMSSISTLEFAWENKSLWSGYLWNETSFCIRVALTNKLELLKWAREEKQCKWNRWTINAAARQGNLEMVKYCVANECPVDEWACSDAAENGHLECLKYLREEAKAPWDSSVLHFAHAKKHLECLRYAIEKKCPTWSSYTERLKALEQSQ